MTNGKPGVMVYFEMIESVKYLSEKNAGILFKAILYYAREGQDPDLPPKLLPLWGMLRNRIDADDAQYQEKVRKNKYNAYVRWQRVNEEPVLTYEEWQAADMPTATKSS